MFSLVFRVFVWYIYKIECNSFIITIVKHRPHLVLGIANPEVIDLDPINLFLVGYSMRITQFGQQELHTGLLLTSNNSENVFQTFYFC